MTSPNILEAHVVIISDTAAQDTRTDKSFDILKGVFHDQTNIQWRLSTPDFIPDDKYSIQARIESLCDVLPQGKSDSNESNLNLIVSTGGTGFALKDVTPEAVEPLLQKKAPGLV